MNVVLRVEAALLPQLKAHLERAGFRLGTRPNVTLFAQRPGVTLSAYASGKLLLTGEQAEEYAGVLVGLRLAAPPSPTSRGTRAAPAEAPFSPHAGTDESGKGDYFGPLCVAAVHVPDAQTAAALRDAGVRDSKLVTLPETGPLASLIRARCPHTTVVLQPAKYNELYDRIGNLNELLAWAHARAIEDLLTSVGDVPVIVDQFARGVLARHLMERGRAATVTERVRGEEDVAVAAASIVARAEFLAGIAALEVRAGRRLPLGATHVKDAARALVAASGPQALREVAKLHFATTRDVLS